MKKEFKYILFSVLTFTMLFINVNNIKAGSATCTYKYSDNSSVICTASDSNPKPSCTLETNGSDKVSIGDNSNLKTQTFQADGTWKCPQKIYALTSVGASTNYSIHLNYFSATQDEVPIENGAGSKQLSLSNNKDGDKIETESNNTTNSVTCVYGDLVLTINNDSKTVTGVNSGCNNTNLNFDYSNLSSAGRVPNGCLSSIYFARNYGYNQICDYYIDDSTNSSAHSLAEIEYNIYGNVPDANGNNTTTGGEVIGGQSSSNLDCSDLGETGKLLKQIYALLKYLIPVMIIGLSIIDFAKVLLNGEEKVYKEAWSKFIKRLGIGVVILILPAILSLIINLSGALGTYGISGDSIFCIFV